MQPQQGRSNQQGLQACIDPTRPNWPQAPGAIRNQGVADNACRKCGLVGNFQRECPLNQNPPRNVFEVAAQHQTAMLDHHSPLRPEAPRRPGVLTYHDSATENPEAVQA